MPTQLKHVQIPLKDRLFIPKTLSNGTRVLAHDPSDPQCYIEALRENAFIKYIEVFYTGLAKKQPLYQKFRESLLNLSSPIPITFRNEPGNNPIYIQLTEKIEPTEDPLVKSTEHAKEWNRIMNMRSKNFTPAKIINQCFEYLQELEQQKNPPPKPSSPSPIEEIDRPEQSNTTLIRSRLPQQVPAAYAPPIFQPNLGDPLYLSSLVLKFKKTKYEEAAYAYSASYIELITQLNALNQITISYFLPQLASLRELMNFLDDTTSQLLSYEAFSSQHELSTNERDNILFLTQQAQNLMEHIRTRQIQLKEQLNSQPLLFACYTAYIENSRLIKEMSEILLKTADIYPQSYNLVLNNYSIIVNLYISQLNLTKNINDALDAIPDHFAISDRLLSTMFYIYNPTLSALELVLNKVSEEISAIKSPLDDSQLSSNGMDQNFLLQLATQAPPSSESSTLVSQPYQPGLFYHSPRSLDTAPKMLLSPSHTKK